MRRKRSHLCASLRSSQIVVVGNSISLSSVESYLTSNFPLATLILESTFVLPGARTSNQLASTYSLASSHPCAEDFNGRPCCFDLTCLGMKHNFPSLKALTVDGAGTTTEDRLAITHALAWNSKDVKSVVISENLNGTVFNWEKRVYDKFWR